MRRSHFPVIANVIPIVFAWGLFVAPSDAMAESRPASKSKKTTTKVVRAQNAETKEVTTISAFADEEIFDRDLSPASQVTGGVSPINPNCTNVFNPNQSMLGNTGTDPQSTTNSPLSNPDSVFSPQQQPSQMPESVASLAAGQGASASMNYVPAMMGDGFTGNALVFTNWEHGEGDPAHFALVSPGLGAGVGQVKLVETGSPIPRDRVMLNYSYFNGVPLAFGSMNVNRITPGFEKTFFDGNASIEVRVPMAWTMSSTFNHDDSSSLNSSNYQLGNLTLFLKSLLYRDQTFALSVGSGLTLPTAPNTVMSSTDGQLHTDVIIKDRAVHIMPFIGGTYTPNERFFAQSMVQVDIAANGNPVSAEQGASDPGVLTKVGTLNDATFLYASINAGYWLYRAPVGTTRITGFAPIAELHYNRSLQTTDSIVLPQSFGNLAGETIGSRATNIEVFNSVVGFTMLVDDNKSVTAGYTAPLGGGGVDKQFTGEFRLLFNWYFGGPTNRLTRVQF